MRALERKFTGDVSKPYAWIPVFIPIGSNIRGKRFKEGSVMFEPNELERALTSHQDSARRMLSWLIDLRHTYIKESQ